MFLALTIPVFLKVQANKSIVAYLFPKSLSSKASFEKKFWDPRISALALFNPCIAAAKQMVPALWVVYLI